MKFSRFIFLAYIAWLMVWYFPAHTRGQYTIGPKENAQQDTESCCAKAEESDKSDTPTEKDKKHCVVCYVVNGYSVPAIFSFDLLLTGNLIDKLYFMDAQVHVLEFTFPFYPVGPPAGCSSLI